MFREDIKEEFNKYIKARFPGSSGAAASYYRAICCVLDYLKIDSFEKSSLNIDVIRLFAYSPKNMEAFLKLYPNFKIGASYVEKGWITAGIKHFELFCEIKMKQDIEVNEELIKSIVKHCDEIDLENILNLKIMQVLKLYLGK